MRQSRSFQRFVRWVAPGVIVITGAMVSAQTPPTTNPVPTQQPPATQPPATPTPPPTVITPPATSEVASAGKLVSFQMRDKPWKNVLEWLSSETGLPIITTATPTGTFSFYGNLNRKYTIPEVIDILNEAL